MESVTMTGYVAKAPFAQGSKSEHEALKISSASEEYYLRVVNQNPFEVATEFRDLIGKHVRVNGYVQGKVLFARDLELCPE
jgi:hypothetical protein